MYQSIALDHETVKILAQKILIGKQMSSQEKKSSREYLSLYFSNLKYFFQSSLKTPLIKKIF